MLQSNSLATAYFILSIAVAMILRVMSISPILDMLNPDWIVLVVIYWCLAMPDRFGVFTAWFVGLLTDVLTGRLLGQYGLIYALLAYFSIKEHRRLRQFPMLQQCFYIGFCLMIAQSIIYGTEIMKANTHLALAFWYPAFTGALVWPLVFWVSRYLRQLARIG